MSRLRALRRLSIALALVSGFCIDVAAAGCAPSTPATDTASRIAAIACAEHDLWYAPFIDANGRLANMHIAEAEDLRLRDGATPAWRRVAAYWQGSGVRWPPPGLSDGASCQAPDGSVGAALCRVFLIDTPWSAVFVSYVLTHAGVPGFEPSMRHLDYVRAAFHRGSDGPYRLTDPDAEAPAVGDILCFSRLSSQVFGARGFRDWLGRSYGGALPMHCDIVVSTSDGRARLVGGNVLQGVTLRELPLNRLGRLWALPHRTETDIECNPDNAATCNFNRQDWVALLKLNPAANMPLPTNTPAPARCCVVCMLPMAPGMRRCPTQAPEPAVSPVR